MLKLSGRTLKYLANFSNLMVAETMQMRLVLAGLMSIGLFGDWPV